MEKMSYKFKVRTFGITREIIGEKDKTVEVAGQTVADLREELLKTYPALISLKSLMIAVNSEYAEENLLLQEHDEIALIPPVSGG